MKTIKPQKLGVLTRTFENGDDRPPPAGTPSSSPRFDGRRPRFLWWALGRVFVATLAAMWGCGTPVIYGTDGHSYLRGGGTEYAVIASAAHDFGCPRSQFRIVTQGDDSADPKLFVVEGCGVRGTYMEVCTGGGCDVVMSAWLSLRAGPVAAPLPGRSTP